MSLLAAFPARPSDYDLASASFDDDTIRWYENLDGRGGNWTSHVVTTAVNGPNQVIAADIDGDGDQDLASASESDHLIAWYENLDGLGTTWAAFHLLSS